MNPVNAWDNDYVVAPSASRGDGDLLRIMARDDNTLVTLQTASQTLTYNLNAGQFAEYNLTSLSGAALSSPKPFQVVQYLKSSGSDMVVPSDPSTILVPGVAQWASKYGTRKK